MNDQYDLGVNKLPRLSRQPVAQHTMGKRGPQSAAAKAAKKAAPAPKAQGNGANKRTPTGAFVL